MLRLREQRTSILLFVITEVVLAWATGIWEGVPDLDTMQTALRGSHCQAQPPQEAVVRRYGCGCHFRAHVAVAGLEWSVGQAPHHPRWHDNRSAGGGAKDGGFLGRPGFADMVQQPNHAELVPEIWFR